MARFVFALEAVLRQRTHAERERMREMAACQAEMTRLQAELRALNDALQGSAADMKANHLTGPIDVAYLAAHRRYTVAMQRKGQSLVQEMARQQRKVDEAQRLLAEAAKERKVIEKLREKQFERWKQDVTRREQADADEVGAQFGYRQVAERAEEAERFGIAGDAAGGLTWYGDAVVVSAKGPAAPGVARTEDDDASSEGQGA
jgi:flagellar FliJ protein